MILNHLHGHGVEVGRGGDVIVLDEPEGIEAVAGGQRVVGEAAEEMVVTTGSFAKKFLLAHVNQSTAVGARVTVDVVILELRQQRVGILPVGADWEGDECGEVVLTLLELDLVAGCGGASCRVFSLCRGRFMPISLRCAPHRLCRRGAAEEVISCWLWVVNGRGSSDVDTPRT